MIQATSLFSAHDICNAIKSVKPDAHACAMILAVLAENNSIEDSTALTAIRDAYDACDTLAGHEEALYYEQRTKEDEDFSRWCESRGY